MLAIAKGHAVEPVDVAKTQESHQKVGELMGY